MAARLFAFPSRRPIEGISLGGPLSAELAGFQRRLDREAIIIAGERWLAELRAAATPVRIDGFRAGLTGARCPIGAVPQYRLAWLRGRRLAGCLASTPAVRWFPNTPLADRQRLRRPPPAHVASKGDPLAED